MPGQERVGDLVSSTGTDTRPDASADPCQVSVGSSLTPEALEKCKFAQGQVLEFYYEEPDAPKTRKEKRMSKKANPSEALSTSTQTDAAASAQIAAPPADAAAQTHASTVASDSPAGPSVGELQAIMESSGGGPLGVAAALIAVVGGTAGFKLWTKVSEQKHEQSMKKLEIEQANAGLQGAQPPPCQAAHHTLLAEIKALNAKVAEQEARLAKAEKATSGINPLVDTEDLEDRVVVLEKAFRKKARAEEGV